MAKRKPKIAEEDKPARIARLRKLTNDTAQRILTGKLEPREVGQCQMKIRRWQAEVTRLNSSK